MKSVGKIKDFSAVVLAAGHSERMQAPKFNLELSPGKSFLDVIVSQITAAGCRKICVVLNDKGMKLIEERNTKPNKAVIYSVNPHIERGRFFSLQCGLMITGSNTPVLIHNADNPFVSPDVIHALLDALPKADYLYPSFGNKGGHPLLISENVAQSILQEKEFDLNIREYLRKFNALPVTVDDEKVLVNINTPEQYIEYRERIKG